MSIFFVIRQIWCDKDMMDTSLVHPICNSIYNNEVLSVFHEVCVTSRVWPIWLKSCISIQFITVFSFASCVELWIFINSIIHYHYSLIRCASWVFVLNFSRLTSSCSTRGSYITLVYLWRKSKHYGNFWR